MCVGYFLYICCVKRLLSKLIVLLLSFCCASQVYAQQDSVSRFKWLVRTVDSILTERRSVITTDTNYVIRPGQTWTFKLAENIKGDYMELFSKDTGNDEFDYYLSNQGSTSTGLSASYHGLTLSYAINPQRLAGKNHDKELGFNIYNNRFGVDFSWFHTKHYSGILDGTKETDEWENATMDGVSIHGYYVFNRKKFSYPAAFTGSWIQKHSAGSWIAGATYYSSTYRSGVDQQQADEVIENTYGPGEYSNEVFILQESIKFKYFSIGVGYAYNFVPNSHWLIHFSILPALVPWRQLKSNNEIWAYQEELSDEERQAYRSYYREYLSYEATNKLFNFTNVSRLSVTYSWKNYFLGLTSHASTGFINCSTDGDTSFLSNTRWKVRCYFGIRL